MRSQNKSSYSGEQENWGIFFIGKIACHLKVKVVWLFARDNVVIC